MCYLLPNVGDVAMAVFFTQLLDSVLCLFVHDVGDDHLAASSQQPRCKLATEAASAASNYRLAASYLKHY